MSITWNTGLAAERARHNLKLKKALKDGAYKRWKKLLKQKAASAKARQDRINRFDKALDNLVKQVKAASPKPKAASSKRQAASATKKT